MPLQNRVTPDGSLIATPARGTLMGNRGCLHGMGDHPLRQYAVRRWIICVLAFKQRQRYVMAPGQYTELFFLDEATALAAGHRPCAECQRERWLAFQRHWAAANPALAGNALPGVDTIDAALHHERISAHRWQRDKVKLTYAEQSDALPDGAFVRLAANPTAYLVRGALLYPRAPDGYGAPCERPRGITVDVLTPRSTVRTLAHGYQVDVHLSAM